MRENHSFYDIFFIYHPADIDNVRRAAAQTRATGINCYFNEDEFGKTADGIRKLKAGVLRSYTAAFVLSSDSAESQLCNELLQYAVSNGKRLVTLILDEDIEVEVHPAIAQNPYVFFREHDDLVARVDELRGYLRSDRNLKLHTELLVLADNWQQRGRAPDLLLPPDRLEEARQWLATGSARHPKPSPLQVEYIHSSRRQPPGRRRPVTRIVMLGAALVIALCVALLLLQRAVAGFQDAQFAAAQTNEAQTQLALTAAEATAASDSAVGLIDDVAATSVRVRTAVALAATAESITATAVAQVTQRAQAASDMRATNMRASEIAELERDEVAKNLVRAGEEALDAGNVELALALAWAAKDALDNPKPAYRLLRRATAMNPVMTIDGFYTLRFQPGGARFAIVPQTFDRLQIYESETWTLTKELTDHEHPITTMEYSRDGRYLITGSTDGEIIIRDSSTDEVQHRLSAHQDAVTSIAVYPESDRLVSAGRLPHLAIWDLDSGERLAEYAMDDAPERQFGGLLVTADEGRIIGTLNEGGKWIMAQWSADTLDLLTADSGGRVYRGYDAQGRIGYTGGRSFPAYPGDPNMGDVLLWDLRTGERIARLDEGFNWSLLSGGELAAAVDELLFISFNEDSALLVIVNSEDGQSAALIDIDSGSVRRRFENEIAARLTSAELLGDGSVLSATDDDRLILWSSADGSLIREIASAPQSLQPIAYSAAANTVVAQAIDSSAYFWRISDSTAQPLLTPSDVLPGTAISPSGAVLLLVEEDGVNLTAVDSKEILVRLAASQVSSAGATFAVYDDGRLGVYNWETGAEIRSWDWDGGEVRDLHLSPNGDLLLITAESSELWLASGNADSPKRLAINVERPSLVRFSPTGDLVLTLHDELALLWESESSVARAAYPLGAASGATVQAAFSASGGSIVFFVQLEGGLAGLTAVELADNAVRRQTFVDVQSATLSASGAYLSLALSDGRVEVIETASGAVLQQLPAYASNVRKLQFRPDAAALISAVGSDLILWDLSAAVVDQRISHPRPVVDFSLSQDGQRILTIDEGGIHRLWQVENAQELLERVEAIHAPRELTCAEREQYLVAPLCE